MRRCLFGRFRRWNESLSLLCSESNLRCFAFQLLEKRREIGITVDSRSCPFQMLNGIQVPPLVYQKLGQRKMRERVIRYDLDHPY